MLVVRRSCTKERLFRVTAGNFVAGFTVRGPVIVRHAPILKKWLAGKTAGVGYRALLNSGFEVEEWLGESNAV